MTDNVSSVGQAHVHVLAALHAEAFDQPWDASAFARLLGQPGVLALMAVAGDGPQAPQDPQGFVLARVAADEAEILTIATRPAVRRRGVGRALMTAALTHAQAMGAVRMFLEVAEDNTPARALYAALGFTEVGRRSRYYERTDGRVDALTLAHKLACASARD